MVCVQLEAREEALRLEEEAEHAAQREVARAARERIKAEVRQPLPLARPPSGCLWPCPISPGLRPCRERGREREEERGRKSDRDRDCLCSKIA